MRRAAGHLAGRPRRVPPPPRLPDWLFEVSWAVAVLAFSIALTWWLLYRGT